ncbi:MAG: hypothetical protein HY077_04485 [Elusimicrobia bacterium]|nr:hypothetical protein [Elusimicrobiota bacterium]
MRPQRIAALALFAVMSAAPCFAELKSPGQRAVAQAGATLISQDPLTHLILTKGDVRSFTATANGTVIELTGTGTDPLQPLRPVEGLVKTEKVKVAAKSKAAVKALPQLEKVAAKKSSL